MPLAASQRALAFNARWENCLDLAGQHIRQAGFEQNLVSAGFLRFDNLVLPRVTGQDKDRNVARIRIAPQEAAQLESIEARHSRLRNDDRWPSADRSRQRLATIRH